MELQPHNLVLHRRCRRRAAAHGRPRLGPLRRPLTQTGDSSTTAAGNTVGDTTYIDEHGLQVQVNWTHYNNGSRGFGGSREWAVQLRFSSVNASGCAAANNQPISLPVCGPGDFFGAPAPPPPGPPPPCPALQNVTLNQRHQRAGPDQLRGDQPPAREHIYRPRRLLEHVARLGRQRHAGVRGVRGGVLPERPVRGNDLPAGRSERDGFGHCCICVCW